MRFKVYEPVLVAGEDAFSAIDIRLRVKGGGHTSQVYALRQAIAKAVVAYYAKYFDAASALELKKKLVAYDRTLLIADPRRAEPKKFGGHGARARRQKSYVYAYFARFWTKDADEHLRAATGEESFFVAVFIALSCSIVSSIRYAMATCRFYDGHTWAGAMITIV